MRPIHKSGGRKLTSPTQYTAAPVDGPKAHATSGRVSDQVTRPARDSMAASLIGFMQGRLSALIDGKIQSFPWRDWRGEFAIAQQLGLGLMEWTLDHERLAENPLMTPGGRREIRELSLKHEVQVQSLTGDIFMQAPFWTVNGTEREQRLGELDDVLEACAELGIKLVVIPLVDNGSMRNSEHEAVIVDAVATRAEFLRRNRMSIAFECDYCPAELARFIALNPADVCGINLDIGNSAALGYDVYEEIEAFGQRILNVHIKDRVYGGATVPLGTGNADIPRALRLLESSGYRGSYILQTARAQDGNHAGTLHRYFELAQQWVRDAQS